MVYMTETAKSAAEIAQQDQIIHTCWLILLYTLNKINLRSQIVGYQKDIKFPSTLILYMYTDHILGEVHDEYGTQFDGHQFLGPDKENFCATGQTLMCWSIL